MKNKVITFFLIISGLTYQFTYAQLNVSLIGDAIEQENNCFIITQDLLNQSGGVWFGNAINLDENFSINYQNEFGFKDADGADGMALVFKSNPEPELGGVGGGLGYAGISPSFIVEFDTFRNGVNSDPSFDHIGLLINGDPDHLSPNSNAFNPVQASPLNQNIEDGQFHDIRIEWTASQQLLEIFFDCELRISENIDIKNTVFNGENSIFFGFVGSTGGLSNLHRVCFNSISFVDNLQLDDESICLGDSVFVNASVPSGETYIWTPTNGVSDPNSPTVTLTPDEDTVYTVTITDACGESISEDIEIIVEENVETAFDPIPPICSGDSNPLLNTSLNGISGTWSPAFDNTTTTLYTFTPNEDECGTITTLEVEVIEVIVPVFDPILPICSGDNNNPLPNTSLNGISGSWSPAFDNTNTTLYTFTPNEDECGEIVTLEIEVVPSVDPIFEPIEAICSGDNINPLENTSINGVSGTWSPAFNNTSTTLYTFTPNEDECSTTVTLEVEVLPVEEPIFDPIEAICSGDPNPLQNTSLNEINGTWSPVFNPAETTLYTFTPDLGECGTTTTLEIEVIPTVVPTFEPIEPICQGEILEPLSETSLNGIEGVWSPELNNEVTTTYTFFPDPNQGCTSSTTLTITVNNATIPQFEPIESVCQGFNTLVLPNESIQGITGEWSPEPNNTTTTTYTFTPDPNQCAVATELTVDVNSFNELILEAEIISMAFSETISIQLNVTGGNGIYEFRLNDGPWQNSNVFENLDVNQVLNFSARQLNGCSTTEFTTVNTIRYRDFFTPNLDGFNDYWNIEGLRDQPNAKIYIFDRYGKLLQQISPLQIGWDGYYNGKLMPSNDYWFRVEFIDPTTQNPAVFSGHFTLKR